MPGSPISIRSTPSACVRTSNPPRRGRGASISTSGTSGGEQRALRVLGSAAGSQGCIAGVALDVTTQRQSEQAMIAARDAAEAANRAKSEFLGQHES